MSAVTYGVAATLSNCLVKFVCVMINSAAICAYCLEQAEQCIRLAEVAGIREAQIAYQIMARQYLAIAEAEGKHLGIPSGTPNTD